MGIGEEQEVTVVNAFQKKQTRLVQLTKVMMGTFRRLATHKKGNQFVLNSII